MIYSLSTVVSKATPLNENFFFLPSQNLAVVQWVQTLRGDSFHDLNAVVKS